MENEIENMADLLVKSAQIDPLADQIELIKGTIQKLGSEGLKKAIDKLNPEQKSLLKGILDDMKKSHRELIARDKPVTLEPFTNSTPSGDYLFNEDHKPKFDAQDELIDDEANKKGQFNHKNQGGNNPPAGWEGQIIKAEPMKKDEGGYGVDGSAIMKDKADKHSKSEKADASKDIEKAEEMEKHCETNEAEEYAEKLKAKKAKLEKALADIDAELTKGGSGSGRKASATPELAKLQHQMHERAKETQETLNNFPGKKKMKKKLKDTMGKMQAEKMEKSVCIAKLAKALQVKEEALSQIWDALAKGASEHQGPKTDGFKYDDGTVGKAPAEADQTKPPAHMVKAEDGKVDDTEQAGMPKYKDSKAKQTGKGEKPESGAATETADATMAKVPSTMGHHGDMKKSSFYQEDDTEESVGLKKSQNPFAHRSHGQNAHYNVDEFIELEHESQKARLKKSKFDYKTDEEVKVPKQLKKGDEEAALAQAKENKKKNAESENQEAQSQRQARVDEKLTRIEEHARPSAQMLKTQGAMKKSVINDLIEKSLDFGADNAEVIQANMTAQQQGAFFVKSFDDEEMENLFKSQDMWK